MLNPTLIKPHFPILKRSIHGGPLAYLDNASTTQKPSVVIEALKNYYERSCANIHRGIHTLSEESTALYEATRQSIAEFIHAKNEEIVFTKNCTESINLVAYSWGNMCISEGDELVVSALEHHANLIPWQELAKRKGAILKIIPLKENLSLDMDAYGAMVSEKTKIVCVTALSNVLGIAPPIGEIIRMAHACGAKVLVDGAQSIGHYSTHVEDLDCDFFAFSAHKMLGPTGVGVLYGKKELLESMHPFLYGGDMIKHVGQFESLYRESPWKFEAGTPNIADVIAFKYAIDFLTTIGMEKIKKHDEDLRMYACEKFLAYPRVHVYCPQNASGGIVSFTIAGVHPHDIASIFDSQGIAIRSGAHCAEPLMNYLGIPATARMSMYIYNTKADIDRAEDALKKTIEVFKI
jgi:cysteine desulfurase/selenocysteine lyase